MPKSKVIRSTENKKRASTLTNIHGEKLGENEPLLSDAIIPEAILPDPVIPDIIAPLDPLTDEPLTGEEETDEDDLADLSDVWEE